MLLENQVDVYGMGYRLYFAQIADGAGQSTLLTANNLTGKEIAGSIFFFDPSGDPLSLPVGGEPLSEIAFLWYRPIPLPPGKPMVLQRSR